MVELKAAIDNSKDWVWLSNRTLWTKPEGKQGLAHRLQLPKSQEISLPQTLCERITHRHPQNKQNKTKHLKQNIKPKKRAMYSKTKSSL